MELESKCLKIHNQRLLMCMELLKMINLMDKVWSFTKMKHIILDNGQMVNVMDLDIIEQRMEISIWEIGIMGNWLKDITEILIMNIMDNWIMEIYMDMVAVYIMMVLLLRENGKTIKWMDLLLINSKIRIYIMDFVNFHLSMEWEYWIWNQKRKYMLVIFGWIIIMDLAKWSRLDWSRKNTS